MTIYYHSDAAKYLAAAILGVGSRMGWGQSARPRIMVPRCGKTSYSANGHKRSLR